MINLGVGVLAILTAIHADHAPKFIRVINLVIGAVNIIAATT